MKLLALLLTIPAVCEAMPIKTEMIKPRAYFQEANNNLLEALDLKSKTLRLGRKDFDQCGSVLVRKAQTLTFSCTLPLASPARISRLKSLDTPARIETYFGSSRREVQISVAPDARNITFTTAFDHTGIDFEVFKFNDDFFQVYAKAAQLTIAEALSKQPIKMQVLESN